MRIIWIEVLSVMRQFVNLVVTDFDCPLQRTKTKNALYLVTNVASAIYSNFRLIEHRLQLYWTLIMRIGVIGKTAC